MKFLFAMISTLNRFQKTRRLFGWLINLLVFFQSFFMWICKKEYSSFSDCLFHFKKQSKHPWINERTIEYSWIAKNISEIKNCYVLDVGAKEGLPSTDLLLNNKNIVYTIDINTSEVNQPNENLILKKGDIRATPFENNFFDAVIAVSTLEHVGISGRYGIAESDEEGDFKAMAEIFRILKPGGCVFITVPYGVGRSLPLNRLYSSDRITKLFEKFIVTKNDFFTFNTTYNMWFEVPEPTAKENNWDYDPWYSLGCFYATK